MDVLKRLEVEFGGEIGFREKRPGIVQVLAPQFHEDGDMIEVYLDLPGEETGHVRISDHGMTLMRLSFGGDSGKVAETDEFKRSLQEVGVLEEGGRLFLECTLEELPAALRQYWKAIARVAGVGGTEERSGKAPA